MSGSRKKTRPGVRLAITDVTLGEPVETNAEWLGGSPTEIRVRVPGFRPLALDTRLLVSAGRGERDPGQMLLIQGECMALDRTRDDLDLDRFQLLRELLPLLPRPPKSVVRSGELLDEGHPVFVATRAIWSLSRADTWWNVLDPPQTGEGADGLGRTDAFRYGLSVLESLRLIIKPWVRTGTPVPIEFLDQLRRQSNALSASEDDRPLRPETRKKK